MEGFANGASEAHCRICAFAGAEDRHSTSACWEEGQYCCALAKSRRYGYESGRSFSRDCATYGKHWELMLVKVNGWPDNVYAASAIRYSEKLPLPKEMSKEDIESFKKAWVAGVKRALACGFDTVEIHNAQ